MVSYEVSIGLIIIVRLVSAFGSAKVTYNRSDVNLTRLGNRPEGTAAWVMSAFRGKAFELQQG